MAQLLSPLTIVLDKLAVCRRDSKCNCSIKNKHMWESVREGIHYIYVKWTFKLEQTSDSISWFPLALISRYNRWHVYAIWCSWYMPLLSWSRRSMLLRVVMRQTDWN